MRTFDELKEDVLEQRLEDNMNLVFFMGREFQVTPKEQQKYGNRLLGYDLVTRTPVVPGINEPTIIVRRGTGGVEIENE